MTLTSLTGTVTEKTVNCRRLKDQLDILERETTDKLTQMEQYNKELKVSVWFRPLQTHSDQSCRGKKKNIASDITHKL